MTHDSQNHIQVTYTTALNFHALITVLYKSVLLHGAKCVSFSFTGEFKNSSL